MATKRSGIPGVIEETTPLPPRVEVAVPPPPTGRAPAKVRSTMDLPHEQHLRFKQWALDAEAQVGRAIPPQQVLRALVARLLTDKRMATDILNDLRSSGQ